MAKKMFILSQHNYLDVYPDSVKAFRADLISLFDVIITRNLNLQGFTIDTINEMAQLNTLSCKCINAQTFYVLSY